ncbi:MAG TPA: class I SAM-dependent methyltransferase [Steroidobacteraceae bacterium]|jgi:SAM-dependent methyltransferase|nr:class I SAM-dependent methyltransferase [Steroidobacteraceae bacterium]
MTTSVDEHYARHLGPVYAWMMGGVEAALARAAAEIDALELPDRGTGCASAIDLGAGFGAHALTLARRGWSVLAIDGCALLLDELESSRAGLPVRAVEADLMRFREFQREPAGLILCLGDTLTHLASRGAVEALLDEIAAALAPGGVFATTFRDYVSAPHRGDARFIHVRSDANRILTCMIEDAPESVTVHDLLHLREEGGWRLAVSSYSKLKLDPRWLAAKLEERGLAVERSLTPSGLLRFIARSSA